MGRLSALLGMEGARADLLRDGDAQVGARDRALLEAPLDQMNRRFVAAWLGWRGAGRMLPRRREAHLDAMTGLRGGLMLFEIGEGDEIRVVRAGKRIDLHSGCAVTGKSFAELSPREEWPMRRWRMIEAATRPCATLVVVEDRQTEGDGVRFEALTLPLDPDKDGAKRLLVSHIAVLGGVYEPPAKERTTPIAAAESFRFLDLGAGVPEKTGP